MLARRIHDDVMQALAACVFAADMASRHCQAGRIADATEELAIIQEGLQLTVNGLRGVLAELHIPA